MKEETTLILWREDLNPRSSNKSFNDINYNDFTVSWEFCIKQPIVLFMDNDGKTKMLKNRYGNDDKLHPNVEKIIRYTIKEWSSLKELENPTHEEMVQQWLNVDFKEWIQNNCE